MCVNGVYVSLQDIEFDVQGLYEDNEYMFRVAAVNENGAGDWLEAESPIVAKLSFGKITDHNQLTVATRLYSELDYTMKI